jgi:hypothetical protein
MLMDKDANAAQIRAQAQFRQPQRPGPVNPFFRGVINGFCLAAALWLILWLVIRPLL